MRRLLLALLVGLFCLPLTASLQVNQLVGFGAGGRITKASALAEWNGATSDFTFTGDDLFNTPAGRWIRTNDQFTGGVDITWKMNASQNGSYVFFYPITSDGSWTSITGLANGGLGNLSGMFSWQATGTTTYALKAGTTSEATGSYAVNDVFRLVKVGTAIQVYKNAALIHTFAGTSAVTVRISAGSGSGGPGIDIKDVSWTQ